MDRKLAENREIERLIRLSAASRAVLGDELAALKERFDVPARIRGSLKNHPSTWLVGSAVSGLAASLLFRRGSSSPRKRRGIPGLLMGLTLTAVRPVAKVWLADQMKRWLSGYMQVSGDRSSQPIRSSKLP